ncbi:glucose/ribitol dehydrogenase [Artemisia annua]|uniref:Glucose/ribitol dehydrogenase n=1 Tax=Artemisia annua TaxID=35608 RepID=A0A2U1MVJ7_ARTAN|nr:glucose/ribitol dehydrogenase [Artemisia annua]
MYEAYFRHKFTNELVLYIFLLLLLAISPFLFIWELINNVRLCFQSQNENMSGKVVLITGASSGLGEFMAYEYAKRGARLAIIAREKPESRLKQVADTARGLGSPDVLFIYADVSKVEECRKFVDDTIKHFGQLDHLVCNAGIGSTYSSTNDVTKFEPVMVSSLLQLMHAVNMSCIKFTRELYVQDINFWGSIYPTHFAIPHLKKTHGKIIVNSSYAGLIHPANCGIYSASKAALISFYESLRFEVSPAITITILKLGFIQTNIITAKYLNDSAGSHLISKDLVAVVPAMEVEPCTKAIVDGVCKGATSISEPRMMKGLVLVTFLFPQLYNFITKTFSHKIFKT